MIYAVRTPVALVGLVLGFLAGVLLHGLAQAYLAARFGDRVALAGGKGRVDLRRHLDPFGAVAALLGGVGWASPVLEDGRRLWRRGRVVAVALAGPVANFALGAAALAGAAALGAVLETASLGPALRGSGPYGGGSAALFAASFGLVNVAMGLLSFVPLPPLEAGTVLFAFAPRTLGWQRAQHRLVESNWGLGLLLLLLVVPLGGGDPPLIYLLGAIVDPLLAALG